MSKDGQVSAEPRWRQPTFRFNADDLKLDGLITRLYEIAGVSANPPQIFENGMFV